MAMKVLLDVPDLLKRRPNLWHSLVYFVGLGVHISESYMTQLLLLSKGHFGVVEDSKVQR